ncbi:bifunctional DNA primase/polymerase [Amycolatopsis kentuckyensis]|uniref:bifunctional DNA primase/polymerase n=1 Tax=Amycolatopsis kentuckyensis TaxID=218823 RepID=UPI000A3944D3|nr:bifunctional DNA primase/polymerase [Amycolatopsis kentuckyensis]
MFPIQPGRKFPPAWHRKDTCPGRGPCTGGHVFPEHLATTDPEVITRVWARAPYNVAVYAGKSGLHVIDCDVPKPGEPAGPDGWAELTELAARRAGPLPDTWTTTTPSGGRQLWFTVPPGCRLAGTVKTIAPHVDTRGWGGYAMAPGSVRPDGAYELHDDTDPVELPGWLVQANVERGTTATSGRDQTSVAAPSVYAAKAVQAECARVAAARPGTRNRVLSTAAYALGQLASAGLLDENYARAELRAAVATWNTPDSAVKDDGVIDTALRAGGNNKRRITPRRGAGRAA